MDKRLNCKTNYSVGKHINIKGSFEMQSWTKLKEILRKKVGIGKIKVKDQIRKGVKIEEPMCKYEIPIK